MLATPAARRPATTFALSAVVSPMRYAVVAPRRLTSVASAVVMPVGGDNNNGPRSFAPSGPAANESGKRSSRATTIVDAVADVARDTEAAVPTRVAPASLVT